MKYIKQFESTDNEIIQAFANYVIESSGLIKYEEGFINYAILDYKKYSEYYTYYFKFDEDFGKYAISIDKLIKFLKTINAKNIKDKNSKKDEYHEVIFDIERDKAKEIVESNKYNM
jgi:hypothetical protein